MVPQTLSSFSRVKVHKYVLLALMENIRRTSVKFFTDVSVNNDYQISGDMPIETSRIKSADTDNYDKTKTKTKSYLLGHQPRVV